MFAQGQTSQHRIPSRNRVVSTLLGETRYPTSHVNPLSEHHSALARRLWAYWKKHPDAQGTVEAIVEWWLLEQQLREAVDQVEAALNELVESGLVTRRQVGDQRMLYKLNHPSPANEASGDKSNEREECENHATRRR